VAPSVEGQNQNKVNAVGDHAQANPTAHSVQGQRGGQVADDIETADIEQGITGHRSNASFRRISRAKTFVAEKKICEQVEGYGLAVLFIVDMITDIIMITKFHAEGKHNFATTSVICVSLCLRVQSFWCMARMLRSQWRGR
jgi:hypothetical protein